MNEMTRKILNIIVCYYPISCKDIEYCYELLKSFDKIFWALELSTRTAKDVKEIAQIIHNKGE